MDFASFTSRYIILYFNKLPFWVWFYFFHIMCFNLCILGYLGELNMDSRICIIDFDWFVQILILIFLYMYLRFLNCQKTIVFNGRDVKLMKHRLSIKSSNSRNQVHNGSPYILGSELHVHHSRYFIFSSFKFNIFHFVRTCYKIYE